MDNVHPDLNPLLYLLDDPDETIYAEIKPKIIAFGAGYLDHFESILLNENNTTRWNRLSEIIK
jgi:hypothetical protein